MQRTTIFLLLPLLVTACAITPPPAAPVAPTAWSQPSRGNTPDWAGLLDPQLAALQDEALHANADLQLAALRIVQAQRQAALGGLRLNPSAGASVSASRPIERQSSTRTVDVGGVQVPVSTEQGWSRSYGLSLGLGWELDLWNRIAATQRASRAQVQGAEADREAARLLIRSQVAERYWSLATVDAQRAPLQQLIAIGEQLLAVQRLRVQEGKLAPIEIDRAGASLQAARSRLADLEAEQAGHAQQLALLVGRDPLGFRTDARLPSAEPQRWQLPPPAEVLERRPDLRRARSGVDAALARRHASEAERYPRLSFSAGVSTGGSDSRDWLSQPLGSLAANLVVPLIDWRRLDLQRDLAQGELEIAALQLRDTLNKALVEVETQLRETDRLRAQADAQSARLAEAARAEQLARLRHEVGSIGRGELLQAQQARMEAELAGLQLQLRRWLAQVQLARVLAL